MAGALQRLDRALRLMLPAVTALVAALLGAVPWPLPGVAPTSPDLLLGTVYFWAIHRSGALPFSVVLLLGTLQDVLTATPLGMHALLLLLVHGIAAAQRRALTAGGFARTWCGLVAATIATGILGWLIVSVYYLTIVWPVPLAAHVLLTIGIYPGISAVLARVDRLVSRGG